MRSAFHLYVYRARQRHFDLCVTVKQVASDAWDLMNVLYQPLHRVRLQSVVALALAKVTATYDDFNHTFPPVKNNGYNTMNTTPRSR